ncbi:MAG: TIR domain-containing protein [Promethearchaeota archaeon]
MTIRHYIYDVFLSHNSANKPAVEELAHRLTDEAGLRPFLDKWHLIPGDPWQEAIEEALDQSRTCAVFIGPSGTGPWQNEEMRAAIEQRVADRAFRVIPVLLPGAERGERGRLPAFLTRTTWVEFRKGLDDANAFDRLVAGIKGKPPGRGRGEVVYDGVCPYRGLQVFEEEHARFFFGREAATEWLVNDLRRSRFLAVIGPSGSGKSSLVRAGLVPALRRGDLPGSGDWPLCVFRPGHRPLESLAIALIRLVGPSDDPTALARLMGALATDQRQLHLTTYLALADAPPARTIALVVDQFEEIFTLCRDEEQRRPFIDNLLYASAIEGGRTVVVLTMRADFYSKCAAYSDLAARITDHQMLVSSMVEEELRQAIERPAQMVGLEFEGGLVEALLRDVQAEPGALPLLQHTLLELWERREGHRLIFAAYREIGGIQGAIAHRAESIYAGFDAVQQAITRRVMLRLVAPGEGTEDTRRRVRKSELLPTGEQAEATEVVIQTLANARLVTTARDMKTGEEQVDVSHEALIRAWRRLREWIDEDRAGLRTHRRLTEVANEWSNKVKDKSYLYRGARLAEAEEWAEVHADDMNSLEREFLGASVRARTTARHRVQCVIAGLMVAMMIFAWLAFFAFQERNTAINAEATADARRIEAEEAQAEAERQRNISRSREIAAVAKGQLEVDAERSLLLAMEAITVAHTFEAENVLREALIESRVRAVLPGCENSTSACVVNDVAWSPDGTRLASASSDGTIQIWDTNARQLIIVLKTGADSVNSLSWSPDGTQLASGASDGFVRLCDVGTGRLTFLVNLSSPINIVAWSPDGQMLAFVASDNLVQVWDFRTGQNIATLAGHESAITDVAWSPDGQHLASASHDNTVRLWDVETGQNVFTLEDHELAVTSVAWSPDGHQLASASYDRTVRLWDAQTGQRLAILTGYKFAVNSVAWSSDGARLATGSCLELDGLSRCVKGEGRLWDARTGKSLAILNGHAGALLSVAWRPNLAQLASASSDGTVRLWDAGTGESLKTLTGHKGFVYDVAWSPDGRQLASASQDKTIRIWDATSTLSMTIFAEQEDFASCVDWSPDGTQLASGSRDGIVRLWNVKTRKNTAILSGHTGPVNDVAWSPDGVHLASASDDHTVQVWDTRTDEIIHILSDHENAVKSATWSPDGKQLASASSDKTVRLWNAERGQNITTLADHKFAITSVTWSPDGRQLAYALEDNTIRLWDVEIGHPTLILAGHERLANEVAWSPDGKYLVTAADDRTVRLWDAETGESIAILTVHADWATSVAWSPHGDRLASASFDHTVRLFYSRYTDLMDIAREQVTRQLSPEEWQTYLGEEPIAIAP